MGKKDTRVAFVNPIAASRAGGGVQQSGPGIRDYMNRPRPSWEEVKELMKNSKKKGSRTLEDFEEQMNKDHRRELDKNRDKQMRKSLKDKDKRRTKRRRRSSTSSSSTSSSPSSSSSSSSSSDDRKSRSKKIKKKKKRREDYEDIAQQRGGANRSELKDVKK